MQISTRPSPSVNMDGELVNLTSGFFSVARGVLRVLVPKEETVGDEPATAARDHVESSTT